MLRVKSTNDFLNAIALLVEKSDSSRKPKHPTEYTINRDKLLKMGRIDSAYANGRPRIIFEGETTPSLKRYPYLSSYTPKANDVVILAKIGNSYIILGKRI